MITFIVKSYLFLLASYYIQRHFFRTRLPRNTHEEVSVSESEMDKKADKVFVLSELEKKADKGDVYTRQKNGDITIAPKDNNVVVARNSEEIKIGNDSYFGTQHIRIGLLVLDKLGLNLSKQPKLLFKEKDNLCIFAKDKLYIRDTPKGEALVVSDVKKLTTINKDRIAKNAATIQDVITTIPHTYFDKIQITNKLNNVYTKTESNDRFITRDETREIVVNNEGYSKEDAGLIFLKKKEAYSDFVSKSYVDDVCGSIVGSNITLVGEQIEKNGLLLEMLTPNSATLVSSNTSNTVAGISMWQNSQLSLVKPRFAYIWVSDENGIVVKGDLVVSSGTHKGYACRQVGDPNLVTGYTFAKCLYSETWPQGSMFHNVFCSIF